MTKVQGYCFFLNRTPQMIWGVDLRQRNLDFLQGLEADYFEYVACTHLANIDTDKGHIAATAIRAAYLHGLETLFTLIGAAIQAPKQVPAWIHRCSTNDLQEIITGITDATCVLPNCWRLKPVTWEGLAKTFIAFDGMSGGELAEQHKIFTQTWARLAQEWTSDYAIAEYNAIKHGFRFRTGGFTLTVAQDNNPALSQQFTAMGESKYGSQFFSREEIKGAPKHHFQLRHTHTNWNPKNLSARLEVISISIHAVRAFLLAHNGFPDPIRLKTILDEEQCAKLWTDSGIQNIKFDYTLLAEHIDPLSADDIRERLRDL